MWGDFLHARESEAEHIRKTTGRPDLVVPRRQSLPLKGFAAITTLDHILEPNPDCVHDPTPICLHDPTPID